MTARLDLTRWHVTASLLLTPLIAPSHLRAAEASIIEVWTGSAVVYQSYCSAVSNRPLESAP